MDRGIELSTVYGPQAWEEAKAAWQEAGRSVQEAELLASRFSSGMVRVKGRPSRELIGVIQREGLEVCPGEGAFYLMGPIASFRAALLRWPSEAGEAMAVALSEALGLSWRTARVVQWPVRPPAGWGKRPVLMGILNVTPDSFSDGGRFSTQANAIDRGLEMVEEGVDIIDIGGESTRPGAASVSVEEEIKRVVPVISALVETVQVPISVDTYEPEVAEAALEAGASIINDISGLRDPAMAALAARSGVPTVVMHMKGTPRTMQENPVYEEVVAEVISWLEGACQRAREAGVNDSQLIIDPGIGFGKSTANNLELLQRLRDFRSLGYPVLIGTSRKSVIGSVLDLPVHQRLEGTAATVALSVCDGADIVRVHDVLAMRRVMDMSQAICRSGGH
jgi:dihydropteroate synthase